MPTKPKKKPTAKRKAAPKKTAAKPKFNLALTDRMKAQGVVKTCWYTTDLCDLCGGQMATNGQTRWCVSGMHA